MLEKSDHTKSIQRDREDLASAIRLAAHFDLHEGICNHFSVQCDGPDELYLINAYGWHWSEVTPDRLLLIDGDGNVLDGDGEVEASARNIHISSHRANPRHKAILHVHMPHATALSMLKGGRLLMAHQTACRFHGRIGYEEEFGGIAVTEEEGQRIAQQARDNSHIDCMFLANHGVVCSGPSVAQAFDDLYYLERAARQQILAMSTGQELLLIPEATVELTAKQFRDDFEVYANKHFDALKRLVA
ncbi:aldolase [Pseudahrensia aquimaris]|uniref:Aldolase n=1 Tax=Pseudahrensia aquimaris TaxID=744461 RepID=A0ABW3FBW7_9HYPH